jgi:hypothetical protein
MYRTHHTPFFTFRKYISNKNGEVGRSKIKALPSACALKRRKNAQTKDASLHIEELTRPRYSICTTPKIKDN